MNRLQFMVSLVAGAWGVARAQTPGAQGYPQKTIRYIVPFAAGGTTDVVARAMAKEMSAAFGQAVVVENRGGAGAVVGTAVLAQSPADGYTIGAIISSHAVNPGMRDKMPYDSLNDFTPISTLVRLPLAIAVHPSHPAKTFKEFLAYLKANPNKQTFGSPGTGTAGHLAGELIKLEGNVTMEHVPYKGGSAALTDLLAGNITMSIHNTNIIIPYMKSGKVRVLAVSTPARLSYMADVPTVAESLPGFDVIEWYGLAGPKALPPEIVQKLSREVAREFDLPSMKARFPYEEGIELAASTPEQFDTFLRAELKRWPPLVRKLGLKAE